MSATIFGLDKAPPKTKGRLLAVRRAGTPFTAPFRICSRAFESLLEERNILRSRIGLLQSNLVEDIFHAVPRAASPTERHALLAVKRAVHNARPVNADDLAALQGDLAGRTSHYNTLATALTGLVDRYRQSVVLELRCCIYEVAAIPYFANAVNYSCPWLLNVFKAAQSQDTKQFTEAERGIAAYAIKFFSKANPLHVFASLFFGPGLEFEPAGECEVIINSDLILKLEHELLTECKDPSRRLLSLRPYFGDGEALYFFTAHSAVVTITKSRLLSAILIQGAQERSLWSLASCKIYLREQFPALEDSAAEQYIRKLIDLGIIDEYMVRDFDDFAAELLNVGSKYESTVRTLDTLHFSTFEKADLPGVDEQIGKLSFPFSIAHENAYHINSYHPAKLLPQDSVASGVIDDLCDLKPLFLRCANFGGRARVLRSYLAQRLSAETAGRLPYLKLLWEFLHDAARIIQQHEHAAKTGPVQAWLAHLSLENGELSPNRLGELLASSPMAPGIGEEESSVCFNGPLDAVKGLYYPTNSFAGHGRFASRYLIKQYRNRYPLGDDSSGKAEVQLIASYSSRSYTSNLCRIGCSFDGRWQHRFEKWIDPSDIEVALTDDGIGYFQSSTEQRLHFRLAGFQLAESLGLEYQLLLLDSHADYYLNPFDRDPISWWQPGKDKTSCIPPLYYASVCLRRQQWVFPASQFEQLWGEDDIVSATLSLLDLIGAATKLQTSDWYFRVHKKQRVAEQPRYLDLHNPLNVQIFRRACSTNNGAELISLSAMEPPRENLFRDEQGPWLTELMIEV
jgi:hypothetical protein